MTIRVDPSVYGAVKSIADAFDWTTSDVASTLLWIGLSQVNPELLSNEVRMSMFSDMLGILGRWAALGTTDPAKAKENLAKTVLLLQKPKGRAK